MSKAKKICSNRIFFTAVLVALGLTPLSGWSESVDTKALVKTCAACHGERGISSDTEWPNLAGQKSVYMVRQIGAFQDGSRSNPLMSSAVNSLSHSEIQVLANYFASLPAPTVKQDKSVDGAGQSVRARCISCHGMNGTTVNAEWPNLAGQKAGYLVKQLRDFRDGRRPSPIMEVIARELSEQEMVDVADYYSAFEAD